MSDRIILDGQSLTALPAEVLSDENLRELHIDNNKFEDLPIGKWPRIEVFHARGNMLREIPDHIALLQTLTDLRLGNDWLTSVPDDLWTLRRLQTLDLSENQIPQSPTASATSPSCACSTSGTTDRAPRIHLTAKPPAAL